MVDALDLGSSGETCESSSLSSRTNRICLQFARLSQNSLIFEHRSGVYIEVNEQRSTGNQRILTSIVEL